ncbi:MAG: acyl-CoA dehydrogenase family protein [Bermanella sp.]
MIITPEHKAIFETVKSFVENEINPNAAEWEKAGIYPAKEVFKKMGDLGMLGINKEEKYGGLGLDYSYNMYAAEALGYSTTGGVTLSIGVQTDMATPAIAKFGSTELKEQFLAPAIAGDYVAAIAVSEAGAGSDVAGLKTTAKKDGDDYIINGSKMWITNATQADFFCVLANTSDDKPHKNKSLIVVPANTPGVSIGEKIDKIGMRSSDTAPVFFDDVRVPQRYRIGAEGTGFMLQMLQFQEERLWGAANSLMGMEQCINLTIDYCRERKTFGQPLINNQAIHFRMAELKTEIELLRALTYRASDLMIAKKDVTELASMCKLKAGRLIREVSDSCLQYWGGMGFTTENPVAQVYRDGRLASIGGGADEIMLGIICKYMDILPKRGA